MLSDMLKKMKGKAPELKKKSKPMAEVEEDFLDEEPIEGEEALAMDQEADEDLSGDLESEGDYAESFDLSAASDDDLLAEMKKRGLA